MNHMLQTGSVSVEMSNRNGQEAIQAAAGQGHGGFAEHARAILFRRARTDRRARWSVPPERSRNTRRPPAW